MDELATWELKRTAAQRYQPYRQSILRPEELRALATRRPRIAVRDTILNWAVIVAAWAFVALHPTWWAVLVAIPVVGTRYYSLCIISHDGLHRLLFRELSANDFLE